MSIEIIYNLRKNQNQFGYEIVRVDQTSIVKYLVVFHTSDKSQAEEALEDFKTMGSTKLIPFTNWNPLLLLLHEKNSQRFFLIRNEEELFKIALGITIERLRNNWYNFAEINPEDEITEEQVNSITNLTLKNQAKTARNFYLKELAEHNKLKEQRKTMLQVKDTFGLPELERGRKAWKFLKQRNEAEYEEVRLLKFNDITENQW